MLKVLHTADWHLGKRLEQCERTDEHQHFLDWLIETISVECIDVLIVAGDIFDTGAPSNAAFKQYYDFLWKVKSTCCREVIIIGGNHDSVTTLNAPKDLLKVFNVHVVGGVPDDFKEQIITVKNKEGFPELIVCAVPFIRDKDVRLSIAGESSVELETRLKKGIGDHYHLFKESIADHKINGIPVIATGHLFAAGAVNSDSEKEIHVGNIAQVGGDQFPVEFDYVALGHLHRPQLVNKMEHVRYSGSPIPLSFSESDDHKLVLVLQFEAGKLNQIQSIDIPPCRKLIRVKGNLETVKAAIEIIQDQLLSFPSWVEVQLETDILVHDLEEQLNKLIVGKPFIERFFLKQQSKKHSLQLDEQTDEMINLTDLDPKSVFQKKCESAYPGTDFSDVLQTFNEALELFETDTH
ncbi:MAG: Nuclease SbcCD subunit [Ferruginibacter sp.]|nr:Nuclease SbcCD subunit [Ferruginibacter sp.]